MKWIENVTRCIAATTTILLDIGILAHVDGIQVQKPNESGNILNDTEQSVMKETTGSCWGQLERAGLTSTALYSPQ